MGQTKPKSEGALLARQAAGAVSAANRAGERDSGYLNMQSDVRFGSRVADGETGALVETWGVPPYNMVEVTVHRDSSGGDGPLDLFFAPVIGHEKASLSVTATAGLVAADGFRIESGSEQTAGALPIAYDLDSWNELMGGVGPDN